MSVVRTPLPEKPLHWVGPAKKDLLGFPEEVVDDFGYALGVAHTVRFEKAVYVLHCFQKKSPSGVRTAAKDVDLIHERLKTARADYEVRYGKKT